MSKTKSEVITLMKGFKDCKNATLYGQKIDGTYDILKIKEIVLDNKSVNPDVDACLLVGTRENVTPFEEFRNEFYLNLNLYGTENFLYTDFFLDKHEIISGIPLPKPLSCYNTQSGQKSSFSIVEPDPMYVQRSDWNLVFKCLVSSTNTIDITFYGFGFTSNTDVKLKNNINLPDNIINSSTTLVNNCTLRWTADVADMSTKTFEVILHNDDNYTSTLSIKIELFKV